MVIKINIGGNPTVSYDSSLKTETRKIYQLKSQMKLPSKYKESTRSSQDIAFSWDSTEVDFVVTIDDKPTKSEFYNMGKSQIINYCEITGGGDKK